MGEAGYKEIWEPMLRGKFGDHWANNVNMAWLWSRIACRTPKLGTFKGGFEEFVRRGEDALLKKGVVIRKGVSHINATQEADGTWGINDGVNKEKFDRLVIYKKNKVIFTGI